MDKRCRVTTGIFVMVFVFLLHLCTFVRADSKVIIDAGLPELVEPVGAPLATQISGLSGGIDRGTPGDAKGFKLARLDKRWQKDNPRAIKIFFSFRDKPSDVIVRVGYKVYAEGTRGCRVYLDDKMIGQFAAVDSKYRMIGKPGLTGVEFPVAASEIDAKRSIHELRIAKYHTWGMAVIDAVAISGEGVQLRRPGTGKVITRELLASMYRARRPHLPDEFHLPPDARAFDFGTDSSPVWTRGGFARATESDMYTPQRGSGWREVKGRLQSNDLGKYDDLRRDYVFALAGSTNEEVGATFSVDVSPGKWHVFLVYGAAPYPRGQGLFSTIAEGSVEMVETALRQRDMILERPSVSHRHLAVNVADGRLDLRFCRSSYFIISAMIICPDSRYEATRRQFRRLVEDYYLPACTEVKPELPERDFQPSDDDRRRGFVVFFPSLQQMVFPGLLPGPGESRLSTSLRATPGEYEPLVVAIRPLRRMRHVKVISSDLRSPKGIIGSRYTDVRFAELTCSSAHTRPTGKYTIKPWALAHTDGTNLEANQTRVFWVTVHVPPDAAPGKYSGSLRIEEEGHAPQAIDIELDVLPFRLKELRDRHHGVWWGERYFLYNPAGQVAAQFADLRRHGFASASAYLTTGAPKITRGPDGKLSYDFSDFDRCMKERVRHGLTGPVPVCVAWVGIQRALDAKGTPLREMLKNKVFRSEYGRLVKTITERCRQNGWPEVLFYQADEPPCQLDVLNPLAEMNRLVTEAGGRSFITVRESEAKILGPWLDAICYGWGAINPRTIRSTMMAGKPLFCYGGAYGGNLFVARLSAGFFYRKIDAHWMGYWVYCWPKGDPDFDLDNALCETGLVRPSQDGPTPTIPYELLREGIDDLRIILTLEQAIADAFRQRKHRDLAWKAARDLADMLRQVPDDGARLADFAKEQPPDTLEKWRATLLEHLRGLKQGAL